MQFAKHVPEFQDIGTQELQYYLPKVLEELTTVQGPTCPSPGKPSQTHSLRGVNSPLSAPSLFPSLSVSDKTILTACGCFQLTLRLIPEGASNWSKA